MLNHHVWHTHRLKWLYRWLTTQYRCPLKEADHISPIYLTHHGLDHFLTRLGPAPPTRPSLHGLLACTYVGTPPCWEPMWKYPVKITNIQVDTTFIIPTFIDGVPSHPKEAEWLKWPGIVTLISNEEEFPRKCGHEHRAVKEEGQGPDKWTCDLARGTLYLVIELYVELDGKSLAISSSIPNLHCTILGK